MNDDVVSAQGSILHEQAEKIQQLIQKVETEVHNLSNNWHGEDSKKFANEWNSTHKAELQKAKRLLDEMVTTINNEVREQRKTSSTY